MKLKLDLHPIHSDSQRIEQALRDIIEDAVTKRASEVEIIPGKGSGALKKSVLRFLDRPEIKAQYHRIDKDSENWGRLFVYFRHQRSLQDSIAKKDAPTTMIEAPCACCGDAISTPEPEDAMPGPALIVCPWCGSPNRLSFHRDQRDRLRARAELDYQE